MSIASLTLDPLLGRYLNQEVAQKANLWLSDEALYCRYCVEIELSWLEVLAEKGFFPKELLKEAKARCQEITLEEIRVEEARVRHDLKAVVNCMASKVDERLAPWIHWGATSYDILSNAHCLRLRKAWEELLKPSMISVGHELARLAGRYAQVAMIGRTHGQWAEPTTFGYVMATFLDRWRWQIDKLQGSIDQLQGKFTGAVGTFTALSVVVEDPEELELELLQKLGLKRSQTATQIVHPEPGLDFLQGVTSAFGILANLADDLRHLQRSEIAEVAEYYHAESQVGSSAMPHKQNPITWENIKSLWKTFMPQLMTYYLDQISEHQRDLSNSASARFIPRLLLGFMVACERTKGALAKLTVHQENMKKHFDGKKLYLSGPLQVLLSAKGVEDAHEVIRLLCLEEGEKDLLQRVRQREDLASLIDAQEWERLESPELLARVASMRAVRVAKNWGESF